MVKPIPDGYTSITPYLIHDDPAAAIEFYKKAFDAKEITRMPMPDGTGIMHAELQIGNARFMLSGEFPGAPGNMKPPKTAGGVTASMFLYVDDVDATIQQAVNSGATVLMPAADQFWGDRMGKVADPFGHEWGIATHIEDVSDEEMGRRAQEFFAKQAS